MATKTVKWFNDSNDLDYMALAGSQRISLCLAPAP